ncbi:hypothetical protein A0X03_07620 [Campylobacter fetus]|nr:hypothetical protein [Campylobacter fetus]
MNETFSNFWQYFVSNLDGHIAFGVYAILFFMLVFMVMFVKTKKLHSQSSSLLITIGITFTFFGIAYGLMRFDANDIERSLPDLINGIKTAFLVSLVGVFSAVVLKIIELGYGIIKKESNDIVDEFDPISLLKNQEANLNIQSQIATSLEKINTAIVGDESSSLISQIKNLRTDMGDNFGKLISKFETFAQQMSENNSKALIEALNGIIRDFNEKLTEQFGENFKELNKAVEKLVVWQDNYKVTLEQTQNAFENTQSSLNTTTIELDKINKIIEKQIDDYQKVVLASQEFTKEAKKVSDLVDNISTQRDMLYQNIQSLGDFIQANSSALPQIGEAINIFQKNAIDNISNITTHTKSISDAFARSSNDMLNSTQTTINAFSEKLSSDIISNNKIINDKISDHMSNFNAEFIKYNDRLNDKLINSLNQASQSINSQVGILDKELENALKNISNNLASISEKIASDYNSIPGRLRNMIENMDRR